MLWIFSDQFCPLLFEHHCPSSIIRFVLAELNEEHIVQKDKAPIKQRECNKSSKRSKEILNFEVLFNKIFKHKKALDALKISQTTLFISLKILSCIVFIANNQLSALVLIWHMAD